MEVGGLRGNVRRGVAAVVTALVLLSVGGSAGADPGRPVPAAEVAGAGAELPYVLAKLAPGTAQGRVQAVTASTGVDDWVRVPLKPGETTARALERAAALPGVETVEPDRVLRLAPVHPRQAPRDARATATATANDPYLRYQWNFPRVRAQGAWALSAGRGVRVAVVDTGISRSGEDLTCRSFVGEYNAITNRAGVGVARDDQGHGTHVAGTIAQCTNNRRGVAGLAHQAVLMPVKVLDYRGAGTISDVAEGIDWARRQRASVINLSLGVDCYAEWPRCSNRIIDDAINRAVAANIVVVAAAGNSDLPWVGSPANNPRVIAVGAVDYGLYATPYTSYGRALDLVAPGGDTWVDDNRDGYADGILQETLGSGCGSPYRMDYCFFEGTSMATPHVTAAVAMLRARRPRATPAQIQDALQRTALDRGRRGRDDLYGYGVLQIDAALRRLG